MSTVESSPDAIASSPDIKHAGPSELRKLRVNNLFNFPLPFLT